MTVRNTFSLYGSLLTFFLILDTGLSTEYQWSANIRSRWKSDTSPLVGPGSVSTIYEMRSRIGLYLLNGPISANFILQDSRILGAEENYAGVANTTVSSFFHQAYFNFPYRDQLIQIGRFELPLGKQRIMSKNNWNNVGRSFEGVLIKEKLPFGEILIFSLPTIESKDTYHNDQKDTWLNGIYIKHGLSSLNNGSIAEIYIMDFQDSISTLSYSTYGTRVEAGIRTLTLESEYALQTSKKISANLASVNLGYKPEIDGFVKNIWLGYDFISGDDTSTVEMEGFSKYFGAGHKYHGFYDYIRHKKFMDHAHEGLREFNLKWNLDFLFETNLLVALHYFNSGDGNTHYGQEIDLIFKKIIFDGISLEQGFALYRPDNDDSILSFIYLMLTTSL